MIYLVYVRQVKLYLCCSFQRVLYIRHKDIKSYSAVQDMLHVDLKFVRVVANLKFCGGFLQICGYLRNPNSQNSVSSTSQRHQNQRYELEHNAASTCLVLTLGTVSRPVHQKEIYFALLTSGNII